MAWIVGRNANAERRGDEETEMQLLFRDDEALLPCFMLHAQILRVTCQSRFIDSACVALSLSTCLLLGPSWVVGKGVGKGLGGRVGRFGATGNLIASTRRVHLGRSPSLKNRAHQPICFRLNDVLDVTLVLSPCLEIPRGEAISSGNQCG